MVLPALFGNLEDSFSYKEVQFKKFCPPVKTSYPWEVHNSVTHAPSQPVTLLLKTSMKPLDMKEIA